MADLHDSVLKMPKGYHTLVGERGLKLSGHNILLRSLLTDIISKSILKRYL